MNIKKVGSKRRETLPHLIAFTTYSLFFNMLVCECRCRPLNCFKRAFFCFPATINNCHSQLLHYCSVSFSYECRSLPSDCLKRALFSSIAATYCLYSNSRIRRTGGTRRQEISLSMKSTIYFAVSLVFCNLL